MIVGIIAVVLAFIPIIGIASFVLGLVAIGLGIFAVIKRRGKGQGIAGIITGAASIVVALIVTIITSAFISILDDELQNPEDFFDMDPAELEELMEDSDEDIDATSNGSADALATPPAYSALTIIGDEMAAFANFVSPELRARGHLAVTDEQPLTLRKRIFGTDWLPVDSTGGAYRAG